LDEPKFSPRSTYCPTAIADIIHMTS
jgi:hypothetical protein